MSDQMNDIIVSIAPTLLFLGLIGILVLMVRSSRKEKEKGIKRSFLTGSIISTGMHCPFCGYNGVGYKWTNKGWVILLQIVLFLLFFIPWVIFYLANQNRYYCPKCGSTNVIRSSDAIAGSANPNKSKCPYCAEEIQAEAIKCKHCGEWLKEKR